MFKFMWDTISYPRHYNNPENKLNQVFHFLFKEYPAFLWTKPSLKKVFILPFVIIAKIIYSKNPTQTQDTQTQKPDSLT